MTAPEVSAYGSRSVAPVSVGDVTLFVQRSGNKLRDFLFDSLALKFPSTDQNTLADHVTYSGILSMAYQQEPNSVIWCALANGNLVAMTYSREQYENPPFGGWHRHPIGGSFGTGRAHTESLATIPGNAQDRDELWLIVKRTINGSTKRYIEYMEYERRLNDDPENSFFLDSGVTYTAQRAAALTPTLSASSKGAEGVTFVADSAIFTAGDVGKEIHYRYWTVDPVDEKTVIWDTGKALITEFVDTENVLCTIEKAFPNNDTIPANGWGVTVTVLTGLDHLEGETVDVLADGATHPPQTVVGGSITLTAPAIKVSIGKNCRARLKPMRLNAGARNGTSQGKPAIVNKLNIRVLDTLGLKYGPAFNRLDEVDFRSALDEMDNPPPLFTGDIQVDWEGGYDSDTPLCFEQSDPLPCTIVALMPVVTVND